MMAPSTFTDTLRVISETCTMMSGTLRIMEIGLYADNVSSWRNMVLLGVLVGLGVATLVFFVVRGRA